MSQRERIKQPYTLFQTLLDKGIQLVFFAIYHHFISSEKLSHSLLNLSHVIGKFFFASSMSS